MSREISIRLSKNNHREDEGQFRAKTFIPFEDEWKHYIFRGNIISTSYLK